MMLFRNVEAVFIRERQILTMLPFSKSTLWRKVNDGTFPKPVKLSERVTAWRVDEIHEWMVSQNV
jgi:prophage regulatory protein